MWWSLKSHDVNTQCGCVLVKNKTVVSTGYNGFIRDVDDILLPNARPDELDPDEISKYDVMIHAEHNAILNCARQGRSTLGTTAYITTEPCNWCRQYMWQAGVREVVYTNFSSPHSHENNKHNKLKHLLDIIMNVRLVCNITKEPDSIYRVNDFVWEQPPVIKIRYVPAETLNINHFKSFLEKFERAQANA